MHSKGPNHTGPYVLVLETHSEQRSSTAAVVVAAPTHGLVVEQRDSVNTQLDRETREDMKLESESGNRFESESNVLFKHPHLD